MTTNQYSVSSCRTGPKVARVALLALAIVLSGLSPAWAQSGTVMPVPKMQWLDNNGDPCNGCLLYTYAAGTLTPLATYTTSDTTSVAAVANANPVVADASGRMTVYLSATTYKFILKTSAGVTLWTQDNVAAIGLNTTALGSELVTIGGDPNVPVTLTAYPSGTTYDKAHAGTLIFVFNSANLVGTYALEGMLLGNGGTVTAALVNLSDGSPDTPLVTIASANATGERQISTAIAFPAAGSNKSLAVKVKVSAGTGRVWALRLVRIS